MDRKQFGGEFCRLRINSIMLDIRIKRVYAAAQPEAVAKLLDKAAKSRAALLFAAQDVECNHALALRSRPKITFTSSRFSRMPSGLPVRYIPEGMRLSGNSQNHFGIFRETCQVYFFTAP